MQKKEKEKKERKSVMVIAHIYDSVAWSCAQSEGNRQFPSTHLLANGPTGRFLADVVQRSTAVVVSPGAWVAEGVCAGHFHTVEPCFHPLRLSGREVGEIHLRTDPAKQLGDLISAKKHHTNTTTKI